jgi:hypothetical protein
MFLTQSASDAGGTNRACSLPSPRFRYNFGATEGEISGERIRKRRPAKHLDFLPPLLEGRRSIQLSYGRVSNADSKSSIADSDTILEALTFYRKGRRSTVISYEHARMNLERLEALAPEVRLVIHPSFRCIRYNLVLR